MTDATTTKTDRVELPFVAAYWPVRHERAETSATRVLGLLDDLPEGPAWRLADTAGVDQRLAMEPATLADQLIRDTEAQEIGPGILSSVLREGVVVVRFALGHGQYGAADSVVMNFSRRFDPVEVLLAVVRHFEPVWAVSGWHRLRRAQRPMTASTPWLGTTTYLPAGRPAVAGADTIEVGDGTVLDFTDRGRIAPDEEAILAAAPGVLSAAAIPCS